MGGASVRKMRDQQKTEGEMGEGLLYGCDQVYDKGDGCVVAVQWWLVLCGGVGVRERGRSTLDRGVRNFVYACFLFMVEKMVMQLQFSYGWYWCGHQGGCWIQKVVRGRVGGRKSCDLGGGE